MASVNIDAQLLQDSVQFHESKDKMVELHNGCICCTLREDLIENVRSLALEGRFDYLLIESTGISEPMPVAATFAATDAAGVPMLGGVAELDTLVTVIDCLNFLKDYHSHEKAIDRNELGAEETDQRSIVDLLVDQVEIANVPRSSSSTCCLFLSVVLGKPANQENVRFHYKGATGESNFISL